MRRRAVLGFLALAACTDPVGDYLGGFGDPVRGAALYAPARLGDTSRWDGDPAGAALAAAQLEFLAQSFATDPIWSPQISPSVLQQLQFARTEMRNALGIRQDAPPDVVIATLRQASFALRDGSLARAEAALSGPAYSLGPRRTLERLSHLPRLPRVAEAAGGVAAEMDRLDRRRR